jgi:hypothetical protein
MLAFVQTLWILLTPLQFWSASVTFQPILAAALFVWTLILGVFALRSAMKLSTGRAVSVLALVLVVPWLLPLLLVLIWVLFGPAIPLVTGVVLVALILARVAMRVDASSRRWSAPLARTTKTPNKRNR